MTQDLYTTKRSLELEWQQEHLKEGKYTLNMGLIPAKSQIIGVTLIIESLFTASSTTTISIGNSSSDATDICPATNVSATALSVVMGPAAVDVWTNTGDDDVELYGITIANSASAGSARVVVEYVQANNLTAN